MDNYTEKWIKNDLLVYQNRIKENQEQIDFFKGYYQRHRENSEMRTVTSKIIGGLENETRGYRKDITRLKASIKPL